MRLFKDAHYDFLGIRRRAYIFSAALVLVGGFFLLVHHGLHYGVDFTGGTLMQVRFDSTTSVGAVRGAISGMGGGEAQIQQFGTSNEYVIRLPSFQATSEKDVGEDLRNALTSAFGDRFQVVRTEAVGPKVGGELQHKALEAILIAFGLTLIYLAFRFEWRFGVAAVIATAHDIVITFGFISAFNVDITLATVAAVLTIVGYSLNDTIIVFDRMRENFKGKRKEEYVDTLNRSINETLPRTILTSGTTVATLVALFIFGGDVIRPFALVLILGIGIGTFSSIFVASPVLLEIENWYRRREARA
jgi:preprotein translocase subunit SecF